MRRIITAVLVGLVATSEAFLRNREATRMIITPVGYRGPEIENSYLGKNIILETSPPRSSSPSLETTPFRGRPPALEITNKAMADDLILTFEADTTKTARPSLRGS